MTQGNMLVQASSTYKVECYENWYRLFGFRLLKRKTPKLKWVDGFKNTVVTAGLNKLLDATFKSGLATPAWYVGLKGTGTIVAGDVMSSHSGWADIATSGNLTNSVRPTFTPGTIASGSVDNSAAKAVFNMNATVTVYGCFMCDNNTLAGTTGTLYGGGDFGSSRATVAGDTLNITVTLTQVTG